MRQSSRRRWRVRAGLTLVELLVAMPLSVAVGTLALAILLYTTRQAHMLLRRTEALDRLEATQLLLRAELTPLRGRDFSLAADSLLEVQTRVALLRVCAAPVSSMLEVSLPLMAGAPAAADAMIGVRAGDSLVVWLRADSAGAPPVASRRRLLQPPAALRDAPCTDLGVQGGMERRWRLVLDEVGTDGLTPLVGAPVEVRRTVRFRLYRSGPSWWLGRQALNGGSWESIQPAVGPLVAPAQGGFRWTLLANPPGEAIGLDVRVRTPREEVGGLPPRRFGFDSSRATVELMGTPPPPPPPTPAPCV